MQTLIMITVSILSTQAKGLTTLSEMLVSHALTLNWLLLISLVKISFTDLLCGRWGGGGGRGARRWESWRIGYVRWER